MNGPIRSALWKPIVALTIVGFGLRAFHLNTQSLWFDEIGTVSIATTPFADLVHAIETGHAEPTAWLSTAYYALLKIVLWTPHASPDWLLRLSSVLIGTVTIPAIAWAVAAFAPATAVIASAAVLAISPFHVWYSQEVRPYVLLVLIAALLMGAYLRALAANRTSWWCAVVLLTTLSLYTHPIAIALPLICVIGLAATAMTNPRRSLPGFLALLVTALAFLPAVMLMRAHGANNAADVRPVGWLDLPYALYAYAVGFSLGPSTTDLHFDGISSVTSHLPVITLAAAAFGVIAFRGAIATRRLPPVTSLVLWSWLLLPLLLAFAIACATPNPFNVRYAIISFPAFVALIGLGVHDVQRPSGTILALALLGLSLLSLANLYFDPRYAKEDCRALAAALATEATADDLIVVNAPYMATAVAYHYRGPAVVVPYPPVRQDTDLDPTVTAAEIARLTSGRTHVWLVLARTFHGDVVGTLPRMLAATRIADRTMHFPGIVVTRYSTPAD